MFKHENEKPQTQRTGLRFGTSSEEALSDLAEGEKTPLIILVFSAARCMLPAAFCVSRCGCSRPYVFILSNNRVALSLYSSPRASHIHGRAAMRPYQLSPCAPGWLMFKQSKEPKHLRGPTRTSLTFPWMEVMTGESGR